MPFLLLHQRHFRVLSPYFCVAFSGLIGILHKVAGVLGGRRQWSGSNPSSRDNVRPIFYPTQLPDSSSALQHVTPRHENDQRISNHFNECDPTKIDVALSCWSDQQMLGVIGWGIETVGASQPTEWSQPKWSGGWRLAVFLPTTTRVTTEFKDLLISPVVLVHLWNDALVWRGSNTQSSFRSLHVACHGNNVHKSCCLRAIQRVSRSAVDNLHELENKHDWSTIMISVKQPLGWTRDRVMPKHGINRIIITGMNMGGGYRVGNNQMKRGCS